MVRVSHPLSHVTHWSCDHVICKKTFFSTFARTMATNFNKVWLKLSWPQISSHVTHLSYDHVIISKRYISSFTTRMTIKLGRVMSWSEGAPPTLSSNFLIKWSRAFEKHHVSTNARPQNSAGDINIEKLTNQKLFLLFKRYYHLIHINIRHFKDI